MRRNATERTVSRPVEAVAPGLRPSADGASRGVVHRVGPNAVIQTRDVLDDAFGVALRRRVLDEAGLRLWQMQDPADMVSADDVNAFNAAIARLLPMADARAVLDEAGARTGDYIMANRIPALAQIVLRLLPARLSLRLLLKAVTQHAWTFAGAARVTSDADWSGHGWIRIEANPVCAGRAGFDACIWHEAVFRRLFSTLVFHGVHVRETQCTGRGDPACLFEISLR
jgi:divinyl protochlorophyllide a 8-vinyl-reductase